MGQGVVDASGAGWEGESVPVGDGEAVAAVGLAGEDGAIGEVN